MFDGKLCYQLSIAASNELCSQEHTLKPLDPCDELYNPATQPVPASTHDDNLFEHLNLTVRPWLTPSEEEGLCACASEYQQLASASELLQQAPCEEQRIELVHGGPFRAEDGRLLQWFEIFDGESEEAFLPDLSPQESPFVDLATGLALPERFSCGRVRLLQWLDPETESVRREVLFDILSFLSAAANLELGLRQTSGQELPQRFSWLRWLLDSRLEQQFGRVPEFQAGAITHDTTGLAVEVKLHLVNLQRSLIAVFRLDPLGRVELSVR